MNKIRVIDLLNKIANGEEVPKKVRYNGIIYGYNNLNKHGLRYCDLEDDINTTFCFLITNINSLNDETEIIEEQEVDYWEEIANTFREYGETLAEKFAKIGRQLDKKIKEKE